MSVFLKLFRKNHNGGNGKHPPPSIWRVKPRLFYSSPLKYGLIYCTYPQWLGKYKYFAIYILKITKQKNLYIFDNVKDETRFLKYLDILDIYPFLTPIRHHILHFIILYFFFKSAYIFCCKYSLIIMDRNSTAQLKN